MSTVVVVGSKGQLAHDLIPAWGRRRPVDHLVGLTHADVQVESMASVRSALERRRPDLVINTAAYHRVDEVEDEPEQAFMVNAVGVRNLALGCRELDATLLHVSTDYVFSGRSRRPYTEVDPVDPVNVYGVSKVAGEMILRFSLPKHFIVRSSGLYGTAGSSGKGGNFVETMLRLAATGQPIKVVDDQVLTPTPTRALAEQIVELASTDRYGTYHATCEGECSWHEFAAEIFRQASLQPVLRAQTTAESGARAIRPAYSVLENRGLKELGLDRMPHWREGLASYLAARPALSESQTAVRPGGA